MECEFSVDFFLAGQFGKHFGSICWTTCTGESGASPCTGEFGTQSKCFKLSDPPLLGNVLEVLWWALLGATFCEYFGSTSWTPCAREYGTPSKCFKL